MRFLNCNSHQDTFGGIYVLPQRSLAKPALDCAIRNAGASVGFGAITFRLHRAHKRRHAAHFGVANWNPGSERNQRQFRKRARGQQRGSEPNTQQCWDRCCDDYPNDDFRRRIQHRGEHIFHIGSPRPESCVSNSIYSTIGRHLDRKYFGQQQCGRSIAFGCTCRGCTARAGNCVAASQSKCGSRANSELRSGGDGRRNRNLSMEEEWHADSWSYFGVLRDSSNDNRG